ncbi:hypothetical protein QBC32DRAFT_222495 [Pseudoneurospora amorphoporcata]|uniref:Uncharacterized protein n=1 Tax=Pseudoneurospora amorphoporcata TaxID=241081 RepID=A0AAN6SBJ9_9PEZI|nr:hypothetical protein QBC32DRAFT_222495 [Pseudoneurospora amorphoporcata]
MEDVDWKKPGPNPLVTHNISLKGLEYHIGRPDCTSDCSVAATKFLGYLRGTQDILDQTHGEKWIADWDIPVYQLNDFIYFCTDDNFTNYTLGQAADWFTNKANKRSRLDHLVNRTLNVCPTQFCKSLIWEGNPDVSGIGINVAFVVQAVLASLFLLFYIGFYISDVVDVNRHQEAQEQFDLQGNRNLADHQPDIQGQQPEQTDAQKPTKLLDPATLRETADDCLEVFWSTCYVFAFTFVISALILNVDDTNHSAGRIYSGYFGYLGAVHSIAVLICLWPWFPGRHKYPALTFSGLLVLLCMMAAVSITFFNEAKLTANKTTFEARCLEAGQSTHYVQHLVKYTPYAVFALILLWGGSLLIIRIRTPKMAYQQNLKHTDLTLYLVLTGILGGFLVLTSLVLVWLSLGFFMYLRQKVAELAGTSYKENEWGFGQVVAVVAWVPLLGQFSAIVICGLAKLFLVDGAKELFKPVPKDQRGTARVLAHALKKRHHQKQQHGSTPGERVPLASM